MNLPTANVAFTADELDYIQLCLNEFLSLHSSADLKSYGLSNWKDTDSEITAKLTSALESLTITLPADDEPHGCCGKEI